LLRKDTEGSGHDLFRILPRGTEKNIKISARIVDNSEGDSKWLFPEYKPDALPLEPTSSSLGLYQIILKTEHKFAFIYINLICLFSFLSQLELLFCV
jgi:hypothetical protein